MYKGPHAIKGTLQKIYLLSKVVMTVIADIRKQFVKERKKRKHDIFVCVCFVVPETMSLLMCGAMVVFLFSCAEQIMKDQNDCCKITLHNYIALILWFAYF